MTQPMLTVVLPTRNRRERLLVALEYLRLQTAAPSTYEVIVVADGCTDDTVAAVVATAHSAAWTGRSLRVADRPWGGAAAARNHGLESARGAAVLFIDDDVEPSPGLVDAHLRHHLETSVPGSERGSVVIGPIEPTPRPELLHREMRRWWREHVAGLANRRAQFSDVFTGNVSVPREAAVAAGGFDQDLRYAEDVEFGFRLADAGLAIVFEPDARATTLNTKPAPALIEDLRRSGRASVQVHRKHPTSLSRLPLGGYGETNLRLRFARGALLGIGRIPGAMALIRAGFGSWASRTRPTPFDRQAFELVRTVSFWAGVREIASSSEWQAYTSAGVPVLAYHSVQPRLAPDSGRFVVSRGAFGRQLRLLRWLGYRPRSLDDIVSGWVAGRLPERRTVAITFDDGYRDNLDQALPLLRERGYPATLFAVSGLLGRTSEWDADVPPGPRPLVTETELRALDERGMHVESHTVRHRDLPSLAAHEAAEELLESKRSLERVIGRPVDLVAYPYGRENAQVRDLAEAAGYRAAFATDWGLNTAATPRFALRRVTIFGSDNLVLFALKLWFGENPFRFILERRRARRAGLGGAASGTRAHPGPASEA